MACQAEHNQSVSSTHRRRGMYYVKCEGGEMGPSCYFCVRTGVLTSRSFPVWVFWTKFSARASVWCLSNLLDSSDIWLRSHDVEGPPSSLSFSSLIYRRVVVVRTSVLAATLAQYQLMREISNMVCFKNLQLSPLPSGRTVWKRPVFVWNSFVCRAVHFQLLCVQAFRM
jgi:hypothetical protein